MDEPHISVLAGEVVRVLAPKPGEIFVDGTVGAGGHTRLLAEAVGATGQIIGLDRDAAALDLARPSLPGVKLVHAPFSELPDVLAAAGTPAVDGILLDLGVSSMQLDDAARGFSFSRPGPIDMRMNASSSDQTALELLRESSVDEIEQILRDYGEERFSRRIAARLKSDARSGALKTTLDLARAIEAEIPAKARHMQRIHPATRTFQALRIAVNRELAELETFLETFPALLRNGGRCAIISFHSLEDRLVKNAFRDLEKTSSLPAHLALAAGERIHPICEVLTKKPLVPGDEEIAQNPRARSAKLRACRKVAA